MFLIALCVLWHFQGKKALLPGNVSWASPRLGNLRRFLLCGAGQLPLVGRIQSNAYLHGPIPWLVRWSVQDNGVG